MLTKILVSIIIFTCAGFSQQWIQGRVEDAQGGAVAGARLKLHQRGGAVVGNTRSDGAGQYRLGPVGAGVYLLEVESAGFAVATREVTVGSAGVTADVRLEVGKLTEQVVVTAGGARREEELARVVTVITGEEIEARNEVTVAEVIRTAPGVQIRQLGGPGALTQVRVRGLRPDATAVLVDGMRFRDASSITGDASSLMANLTVVNAERVEVARGSSAALYGTGAVGGAVNIVSEAGGGPAHGMVQAEGGGLGYWRGRATVGGGWEKGRLVYSAGLTHLNVTRGVDGNDAARSNALQAFARKELGRGWRVAGRLYGVRDFAQLNVSPGTAGVPSGNFAGAGLLAAVPLAPEQVLNLNAGRPVNYGAATYVPGRDDPDNRQAAGFTSGMVRVEQDVNAGLSWWAAWQQLATERRLENGPGGAGFQPAANNLSEPGGRIGNLEGRVMWRAARVWRGLAGYEFEDELYRDRQFNGLAAPRTIRVDGRIRQRANAAYAQQQFSLLGDRLQVNVSGRVQGFVLERPDFRLEGTANNYNRELPAPPTAWTGDVSVAYLVARTGTKWRAHMGNAYRAPGLYERFGGGFGNNPATGQVTFSAYGDPLLQPDRYNTYDVGVDQYVAGGRARLSATWFYNRIKQLTAFDFSGRINAATDPWGRSLGYLNGGGGIARGVEVAGETRLGRGFTANGSYTFTNAVNDRDSQVAGVWQALTTPRHTATAVVTQRVGRRGDVAVDVFRGSSYLVPFFAVSRTRAFVAPGFTKMDLVGGWRVWEREKARLRLYGKVENLLGQDFYENGWRAAGRWGLMGLQLQF